MNKIYMTMALLALAFTTVAQTNLPATNAPPVATTPAGVLSTLEGYLTVNDTNYNGWVSNHFTVWQAAVFASVNGTPGESSVGNDLGLEIPIHRYDLHLDSITRFEQLFGDVHSQSVGVAYDYDVHQIQLSAGLDVRYVFAAKHVEAVPYIEFKKASTLLYGTAPFIRYSFPIQSKPGAGEVDIGLSVSF